MSEIITAGDMRQNRGEEEGFLMLINKIFCKILKSRGTVLAEIVKIY